MKLLKFYTNCCPQCKQQTKILNEVEEVEIVPINCEENEKITSKYNVRTLPTLILLNDNDEVLNTMTGITSANILNSIINCAKEGKQWDM